MKKVFAVVAGLCCLVAGFAAAAQEKDIKGGKDHPQLTRMPDFHISDYREEDYGSHRFTGPDKKPAAIEGHKYLIGYTLNKGAAQPGELKIRRNVQDALKKVGAASRLLAHGVSSLAPVSSNDSEEGRAKNRRVELVQQ